ncbi:MAG: hypothetical protein Q7U05_03735 [Polaromonas sp.]|nr:hypothetical protein [Polaromonas sp.]
MSPAVPPLATLALASVLAYHFGLHPSLEVEDTVAFGGTIASVGSTMLGFMLASLAVLASINHTHLVGMMKKNGHYEDLLLTVFVGALVFLICATGGFALIFGANPSSWLLSLVVGCHLAALVSLLDVGRKFWLVLSSLR